MYSLATQYALALVRKGATWKLACDKAGIAQSTLARAIKRESLPKCPTCGRIIKRTEE